MSEIFPTGNWKIAPTNVFTKTEIGTLRSACYSPDFGKCLGIAMVDKTYQTIDQDLNLQINGIEISAKMTNLPFQK